MPLEELSQYAPGELITSAWANTLYRNIMLVLDGRTGGDPEQAQRFLASISATNADWRLLQSSDFAPGIILDAAMANQKVNQVSPVVLGSFGAATDSGFYQVDSPTDAPPPYGGNYSWHLVQARMASRAADYRVQLVTRIDGAPATFLRVVYNGTPQPWYRMWNAANMGSGSGLDADTVKGYVPVNKAGDSMTGSLTIAGYLQLNGANGSVGAAQNVSAGTYVYGATGVSSGPTGDIASGRDISASRNIAAGGALSAGAGGISTGGNVIADSGLIRGSTVEANFNLRSRELDLTGLTGGLSLRAAGGIKGTLIQGTSFDGGATNAGTVRALGMVVGVNGISCDGGIFIQGQQVYWPGNPPPGGGTGGTGGNVPTFAVLIWPQPGLPAGGWQFYTSLNDRFPLGAGGRGINSSGGAPSHGHSANLQHSHGSAALGIGGSILGPTATNGLATPGGQNLPTDTHGHGHNLDVSGSTDPALGTSQSIPSSTENSMPPYWVVNYIQKT